MTPAEKFVHWMEGYVLGKIQGDSLLVLKTVKARLDQALAEIEDLKRVEENKGVFAKLLDKERESPQEHGPGKGETIQIQRHHKSFIEEATHTMPGLIEPATFKADWLAGDTKNPREKFEREYACDLPSEPPPVPPDEPYCPPPLPEVGPPVSTRSAKKRGLNFGLQVGKDREK